MSTDSWTGMLNRFEVPPGAFPDRVNTWLAGVTAGNPEVSLGLASTGIRSGGLLTINADPTKFNVSAGSGWVVSHPAGLPSVYTEVVWPAFTAQVIANLATSFATDIAIDASGVLLQQDSYTDVELRSVILLGGLDHSNLTSIINTFPIQKPVIAVSSNVADLAKAVGDINLEGNVFGANGVNLFINKSAGEVYSYGRNNAVAPSDPSKVTTPQQTAVSFGYVFNNGGGFGTFVAPGTSINPNNYDNGTGTLAVVGNNNFTIQRVLFFANANKTFIQYGTQQYNTKNDALDAVVRAAFLPLPGIRTAMVRGYIILKKSTTDLSSADNVFLASDKFGVVAGVGAGGNVTGVTGTAPIVSTGGAAPVISISAATTLAAGSMSATDKTKLDGVVKQTSVTDTTAGSLIIQGGTNLAAIDTVAIGYSTGSGGAVTQATSKATGVTLNKPTGAITLSGVALAAATVVSFTLTNSRIAAADVPLLAIKSGATAGAYALTVDAVAAGSCRISLRNQSAGSLSEAIILSFVINKGAIA
jgi:hypothetical protein